MKKEKNRKTKDIKTKLRGDLLFQPQTSQDHLGGFLQKKEKKRSQKRNEETPVHRPSQRRQTQNNPGARKQAKPSWNRYAKMKNPAQPYIKLNAIQKKKKKKYLVMATQIGKNTLLLHLSPYLRTHIHEILWKHPSRDSPA